MRKYEESTEMLDEIMDVVSEYYNVPTEIIKGTSRKTQYTRARHMFCYLAKKFTNTAYKVIGAYINKDHTTVINSNQIVKDCMYTKSFLYNDISHLDTIVAIKLGLYKNKIILSVPEDVQIDALISSISTNFKSVKLDVLS